MLIDNETAIKAIQALASRVLRGEVSPAQALAGISNPETRLALATACEKGLPSSHLVYLLPGGRDRGEFNERLSGMYWAAQEVRRLA